MKKFFILFATALFSTTLIAQPSNRLVQVAILFDTSNSMDGLIDQAKSRIWNIVNEVSSLTYNGVAPDMEFALYHYGNDNLKPKENYIEQVLGLTSDLDLLSEKLFGLTTNGGSEFCGAVIGKSLDDLKWSNDPSDLKMIYIAGNEPFNQGPVDFKVVCKKAAEKGVYINTIYCGPYEQGVREFWKDGADCSEGDFFNIDSDKEVVHIKTPHDSAIDQYNDSLNQTYIGYGSIGSERKRAQIAQDSNAESQSMSVKAERAVFKSKGGRAYNNASWDLIDAVDNGKDIDDIKEEELPEELQGKTKEEKEAFIDEKKQDRKRYQEAISDLAKKRQAFIDEEMKKRAEQGLDEEDDFGNAVNESIVDKAKEVGFDK